MTNFKLYSAACITFALMGCSAVPNQSASISHAAALSHSHMQKWQVHSKVAVRSQDEGHNVLMDWQQTDDAYVIRFYSSFAPDSAQLIGDSKQVTLKTSDGNVYHSEDPSKLVAQHLGWTLPFSRLGYWIKGQVAPQSPPVAATYDKKNNLRNLEQDGWKIEYQEYTVSSGMALPLKIYLTDGPNIIKLYIIDWKK